MAEVAIEQESDSSEELDTKLISPPLNSPYPLQVQYCEVCSLPPEYCEYLPPKKFKACHPWLLTHASDLYPNLKNPPPPKPKPKRQPNGRFFPWSSIYYFHHVRSQMTGHLNSISYRGKVKLHGTNCGVSVQRVDKNPNSEPRVFAQSRSTVLGPKKDHHGFFKFVKLHEAFWKSVGIKAGADSQDVIFFGEWCGKGIMKGVAISSLPFCLFAVFAVQVSSNLIIDPETINALLNSTSSPPPTSITTIPYETPIIDLILSNPDQLGSQLENINQTVQKISEEDPFVKRNFQLSGPGEGLVWYPVSEEKDRKIQVSEFFRLTFKTKSSLPAQIDLVPAKSTEDFIGSVVSEARLDQGFEEVVSGDLSEKKIGDFVSWILADVKKENEDLILASGLKWEMVEDGIKEKARTWFLHKLLTK
eukprot:TRINITY_DN629_c0_g1_i1.p1 TRINITY_DN629_c0_g1~~TRINITY_DN629_c0_g1_i1.p1  ORF type:complete len:418 (+),score=83.08 TRINITY_DN629_c0_g1_i1:60-1313(+)